MTLLSIPGFVVSDRGKILFAGVTDDSAFSQLGFIKLSNRRATITCCETC